MNKSNQPNYVLYIEFIAKILANIRCNKTWSFGIFAFVYIIYIAENGGYLGSCSCMYCIIYAKVVELGCGQKVAVVKKKKMFILYIKYFRS